MKFKTTINSLVMILALFTYGVALAADPAPLVLLKQTSNSMLSSLEKNKAAIKRHPNKVDRIVRKLLLPHIDLSSMSRSVVGRAHWQRATPAQRGQFSKEFAQLVIGTYSAPLASYEGDKIRFIPIRGYSPSMQRVQVQSRIFRPSGQVIPVSYRLVKRGGKWLVYDFSVEGISMVQSYRSQFQDVLQNKGMAGLLQQLRAHNRSR